MMVTAMAVTAAKDQIPKGQCSKQTQHFRFLLQVIRCTGHSVRAYRKAKPAGNTGLLQRNTGCYFSFYGMR
jgi:hypothetical protein